MPLDGDRSILFSLVDMLRCVFLASLLLAIFASSGGRGGDSLARITPRSHMSRLDAIKSMYAFEGFVYDIDVSGTCHSDADSNSSRRMLALSVKRTSDKGLQDHEVCWSSERNHVRVVQFRKGRVFLRRHEVCPISIQYCKL